MSISVRVADTVSLGTKGITGKKHIDSVVKKFEVSELKDQIEELSQSLNDLFSRISTTGNYQLDTIDVGLEISSEGGINLIGTMTVGASASIKLSFKNTARE